MRATFRNLFDALNLAALVRVQRSHAASVLRWTIILVPMAAMVGTLCAAFLWSLDAATHARFDHPWLLFLLPVGGGAVGWLYHRLGKSVEGGNNLIVEQIHEPGGGVPLRMAPLIFLGTVVTHLLGGSAGREGTAVQLGGSLASATARLFRLDAASVRILLMAGIAAGFGAVFGTPLAGAVFALEVLAVGRMEYAALLPCLVAGLVGDWTCHAWGIRHPIYPIHTPLDSATVTLIAEPLLLAKSALAGVAFGLAGLVFAEANHGLGGWLKRAIPYGPARPVIGGLAVIALTYAIGTRAYLGLGVWSSVPGDPTILGFFAPGVDPWSWAFKMLFTVVTLSAGFKGGEVTPLFFIGAALGHALAGPLHAPVDLFAGLGFVAVFAGAANTPLACTFMGVELFGGAYAVPIAVACFMAYLCSGHSGIYLSQRVAVPKRGDSPLPPDATLRDARMIRPGIDLAQLFPLSVSPSNESDSMRHDHDVTPSEVGMIRIYLKPSDKEPKAKRGLWSARPLYRALVAYAKADGILNAVAHHAHYGYSNHGPIRENGSEIADPQLTMCVELIGRREQLETFCSRHGDLLASKVIVYKHVEHWSISPAGVRHEDASEDALAADGQMA